MAPYPSKLGKLTANRFNRLCAPLHLALDLIPKPTSRSNRPLQMEFECFLVSIMMMEAAMKHDIPLSGICQHAAFLAVTRFLGKLLVRQMFKDCQHWLELCLAEISWQRYKKRTRRSFPRVSKGSYGKWGRRSS